MNDESPKSAIPQVVRFVGLGLVALFVVAFGLLFLFAKKPHSNLHSTAAWGTLKQIHIAQTAHFDDKNSYAALEALIKGQYLEDKLADGVNRRYLFKITFRKEQPKRYSASASPEIPGETGDRWYFIDESGQLRMSKQGPATKASGLMNK